MSFVSRRADVLHALRIALLVFSLDQGLKILVKSSMRLGESIPLIPGFLSLTYIENEGGAFGILDGSRLVLLAGSAVAVGVVLWLLLSGPATRLMILAYGLVLGGAAGNVLDRLTTGSVTDYIHFSFWYIFNVADAAITVGVVLLLLAAARPPEKDRAPHPRE